MGWLKTARRHLSHQINKQAKSRQHKHTMQFAVIRGLEQKPALRRWGALSVCVLRPRRWLLRRCSNKRRPVGRRALCLLLWHLRYAQLKPCNYPLNAHSAVESLAAAAEAVQSEGERRRDKCTSLRVLCQLTCWLMVGRGWVSNGVIVWPGMMYDCF